MKKFVILTDSGSDLEKSLRDEFDIEYVPTHISRDGKDYEADLDWRVISFKDFYNAMREGARFISTQVNIESYKAAFRKFIQEGNDVLYVSSSSGLSASIKTSYVARDEVLKEYPEAKIICVDSLRGCYALGLLAIRASELRAEGKTIEETAAWIEENKQTVNMIGSVDKLTYLKQAGRVSATSAFFGGLLNIKPIITADALGRNFALEKVRGRRTSMERSAELMKEAFIDGIPYQRVMISHADCEEEAEEFKKIICETLGKEIDVHIGYVGPCVGSATGPGMLGVYFFGKKVTVNAE